MFLTCVPTGCPALYFSYPLPWEPFPYSTCSWLQLTPLDTLLYIALGNIPTLWTFDLSFLYVLLSCMIHPKIAYLNI
jgi:hypothetical protein